MSFSQADAAMPETLTDGMQKMCLHDYGAVQQSDYAEFRKAVLLKDSKLKEDSWHTAQAYIAQHLSEIREFIDVEPSEYNYHTLLTLRDIFSDFSPYVNEIQKQHQTSENLLTSMMNSQHISHKRSMESMCQRGEASLLHIFPAEISEEEWMIVLNPKLEGFILDAATIYTLLIEAIEEIDALTENRLFKIFETKLDQCRNTNIYVHLVKVCKHLCDNQPQMCYEAYDHFYLLKEQQKDWLREPVFSII